MHHVEELHFIHIIHFPLQFRSTLSTPTLHTQLYTFQFPIHFSHFTLHYPLFTPTEGKWPLVVPMMSQRKRQMAPWCPYGVPTQKANGPIVSLVIAKSMLSPSQSPSLCQVYAKSKSMPSLLKVQVYAKSLWKNKSKLKSMHIIAYNLIRKKNVYFKL